MYPRLGLVEANGAMDSRVRNAIERNNANAIYTMPVPYVHPPAPIYELPVAELPGRPMPNGCPAGMRPIPSPYPPGYTCGPSLPPIERPLPPIIRPPKPPPPPDVVIEPEIPLEEPAPVAKAALPIAIGLGLLLTLL